MCPENNNNRNNSNNRNNGNNSKSNKNNAGTEASAALKQQMKRDIIKHGFPKDSPVLDAMLRVPRHLFVETRRQEAAYQDNPLGIGCQQTISQPFIVALMSSLLGDNLEGRRILEIGTGSGYQAAVLAELGAHVFTIERHKQLFEEAKTLLGDMYPDRVSCFLGNGSEGLKQHAPYDGIIVTAYAEEAPAALTDQLAVHGRLVIPLGDTLMQWLYSIVKQENGELEYERSIPCRFEPLVNEE